MVEKILKLFSILSKSHLKNQFHKINFYHSQNFPGMFFFGKSFPFFYYLYAFNIALLQTKKGVLKSTPSRYQDTSNTLIALTISNVGVDNGY
jgi:hypothetical protein